MNIASNSPLLRFGIAGLGAGANNALKDPGGLSSHPHVKVTAAADLRPVALERFASQFGGETYRSVEDLCKSPNVDAVYVLTPNRFHAEHAITAAQHGKQVIVDKPMAVTVEDCDQMIDAARRNGVRMLIGHSQSLDAPILKMAEIVQSGELGKLLMMNQMHFSSWLYSARSQEERDPQSLDGHPVLRQGWMQVDIVRLIAGGRVRSVRASTAIADPERPVEGSYLAHFDFEGGAAASLAFSVYAHFQTSELTWGLGLGGRPADPDTGPRSRRRARSFLKPEDEWAAKERTRYGGDEAREPAPLSDKHQFWGFTLVSCEGGDIRQSPDGLMVYGDDEHREIKFPPGHYARVELDQMYNAWIKDEPLPYHDGPWGKATLEACLAILQSGREHREVTLAHQVPPPGIRPS